MGTQNRVGKNARLESGLLVKKRLALHCSCASEKGQNKVGRNNHHRHQINGAQQVRWKELTPMTKDIQLVQAKQTFMHVCQSKAIEALYKRASAFHPFPMVRNEMLMLCRPSALSSPWGMKLQISCKQLRSTIFLTPSYKQASCQNCITFLSL